MTLMAENQDFNVVTMSLFFMGAATTNVILSHLSGTVLMSTFNHFGHGKGVTTCESSK